MEPTVDSCPMCEARIEELKAESPDFAGLNWRDLHRGHAQLEGVAAAIAALPDDHCQVCGDTLAHCGGCPHGDILCDKLSGWPLRDDVPYERRCDIPLLNPCATELPDHLCIGLVNAMLQQYVWPRVERGPWSLDFITEKYAHVPGPPFPVPAGQATLAAYAESYGLTSRDFPPPLLPNHPEAWIMLVLKRERPEGMVTLYGLVEEGEERRFGVLGAESWVEDMQWDFTQPVLQIEHTVRPQLYDDPLVVEGRRLWNFYTTHVLSQPSAWKRSPGRRHGPLMDLVVMKEMYTSALAEVRERGRIVSLTSVATFMGVPRTTLSGWISKGYLPEIPE